MARRPPQECARDVQVPNIIPLPRRHRGDPDPRRTALASIGFQWRQGAWRLGQVVLTDEAIDAMDERTWQPRLRRWTWRRPLYQDAHRRGR